jgi:hypothetical protein
MRKFIPLIVLGVALSFTACNNNKKSEKEIDSLNQASADSLLNAALADSTKTDSIK